MHTIRGWAAAIRRPRLTSAATVQDAMSMIQSTVKGVCSPFYMALVLVQISFGATRAGEATAIHILARTILR